MIGLCSITFRNKSPEEIIKLVKSAELETIEWASEPHIPETDRNYAAKITRLMDEANLKTSSYGTYYHLGSFNDFQPFIEVAKTLNTSIIRVWAGKKASYETTRKYRDEIIEDAKRISKLIAMENLIVAVEYHSRTLTDTPKSAVQLMEEINLPNILLYWQPAENLSVSDRLNSIPKLAPWITNVHVFHWEDFNTRYSLKYGYTEWKQYIESIRKYSPHKPNYLLEFVLEDEVSEFIKNAETLKKLVR